MLRGVRRSGVQRGKRECAGCVGSRVILPALLLILETGEGFTNDLLNSLDYPS